jgi:uncharacterized GH25 family protein
MLTLLAAPATAHDFWIVPSELVVPADKRIPISLFVGEAFVAEDEKPFQQSRVVTFRHFHGQAADDVLAEKDAYRDGAKPMATIDVRGAGGHLLAMDRKPTNIELTASKFEDYLRHEGLAPLVELRAKLGESGKPGRERYSRYLKSLIQVGDVKDDVFGIVTGAILELVPQQHPVFVEPGRTLSVQVRFRGQPLPLARLEAASRQGANIQIRNLVADERGLVSVPIDRRGVWLLRMVHMVRCEGCADADWESFWTSYTFASWPEPGKSVVAPSMKEPAGARWPLFLGIAAVVALLAWRAFAKARK